MEVQTVIEVDAAVSKTDEKIIKNTLSNILQVTNNDSVQIYSAKEYPFESEYATDVATKLWALKALESVDWRK